MKNIRIKNNKNKILVGDIYKTGSKKIIIISHGFVSDRHAGGKLDAVAKMLSENGFDVIAFDYSGCGESNKSPISITQWENDLKSIVKYVNKLGYEKVGILGSSLGCLIAAKIKSDCLVLWAPVTAKSTPNVDDIQKKMMKTRGYYFYKRDNGLIFRVAKSVYYDRQKIDQKAIMNKILWPTLIIHGTLDTTVSVNDSINAIKYLKKGKIKIIKGADHKLRTHLDIVLKYTLDWFKKNL